MKLKIFMLFIFTYFNLFSSILHIHAESFPTNSNYGVTNTGETIITSSVPHIETIHPSEGNFSVDSEFNMQYNQLSDVEFQTLLSQVEEDNVFFEPKIIIGQDTRQEILDSRSDHDYRTTVWLNPLFPNGVLSQCSGTLVSENKVLTAAHCLYNERRGGWAKEVYATPGQTYSTRPYGTVKSRKFFVNNKYIHTKNWDYDYAVIELEQPIGQLTGWKGIATNVDRNTLEQNKYFLAGYPSDKITGSMWVDDGDMWLSKSNYILPNHLYHTIGTFGGNSGSSIYRKLPDMPSHLSYIVALHIGHNNSLNIAINLTNTVNTSAGSDVLQWIGANDTTSPASTGQFEYRLNHTTQEATIIRFQGVDKDIAIPAHYTYNDKQYKITHIENHAFANMGLNSVMLPNTLTNIGHNAFVNNNLTHIKIPTSLVRIESSAFSNNNLKQIEFYGALDSMGSAVFSHNPVEYIDVPKGTIDTMAPILSPSFFNSRIHPILREAGIPRLQWDGVSTWLPYGTSGEIHKGTEGLQFTYNQHSLQATVSGYIGTSRDVTIPSSVMHNGTQYTVNRINYRAFAQKQLTSVVLPNTLIDIGEAAFLNNNLTEIVIPDSVTQIQNSAFRGNALSRVFMPKSITHLPEYAFGNNRVACSFIVPVGSLEQMKLVISSVAMQANNTVYIVEGNSRYVWAGIRGWEPAYTVLIPMPGPVPTPF